MEYISVSQFAEKHGVSERTARNYCATGKIESAFLVGKSWNIPVSATLPKKGKAKLSPLLSRLREEKESRLKGGIYHRVQIDLTYNSNHIEGSRLTKEQTRYIFETNTLGVTTESTRVDDIIEILDGPLASFVGTVTGVINSSKKCGVFVELPLFNITGMINMEPERLVEFKAGDEVSVRITDFEQMLEYDPSTGNMVHQEPYKIENGCLKSCILKPVLELA